MPGAQSSHSRRPERGLPSGSALGLGLGLGLSPSPSSSFCQEVQRGLHFDCSKAQLGQSHGCLTNPNRFYLQIYLPL